MPEQPIITGPYGLNLPGWEHSSIWGLDRMEATYGLYAQLWRNTDSADNEPQHWIMEVQDLPTLARKIVAATGASEHDVVYAIAKSAGLTLPV
jgi:hypothetical protein